AEAEEGRRVQQVLAMTALSHVRRFNPRSFYALQRLGVLRDPPPELSADQLAAFTDPAHPTRISASPGPFVFLHEPTRPGEGQAFSVLVFLLDANRAVRDAAVRFFLGAPQEADSWLSPRSHAALAEYGQAVRSEEEARWLPASRRLYEILEEDFLLNLAGFRQARQARLVKEQNEFWRKILRPGLSLFASVPPDWYVLPEPA